MIVIDTHVWIWWVDDSPRLKASLRERLDQETDVLVSAISLLEITTACAAGRLVLKPSLDAWLQIAQLPAQLHLAPITAELCVASSRLPGEFHRDPGDRLIVALARQLSVPLATADHRILAYSSVTTIPAE